MRLTMAYDGESSITVSIYKTSILGNIDTLLQTIGLPPDDPGSSNDTANLKFDVCIPAGTYALVLIGGSVKTQLANPLLGLSNIELLNGTSCTFTKTSEGT
jgi:hypothetical protein